MGDECVCLAAAVLLSSFKFGSIGYEVVKVESKSISIDLGGSKACQVSWAFRAEHFLKSTWKT